MKRRTFCRNSVASGIAASLYSSGASAFLNVVANVSAVTAGGDPVSIEKAAVSELADSLDGSLILANNRRYDSVRKLWNGMIDRRPAMIALCANATDVSNAVTFAAERDLLVAVKGGGHSYPGKSSCDNGLVIDLSNMRNVTVNAKNKTMSAGGGALLSQLDTGALAHNMITTTGVVSHTGVGGFTLGGGMGRVNRKFGLAVDNVLAATLVTADGQIRRVSADENPDLFWAIRGGGGNFGVATEFQYRTHPFDPNPLAGTLTYSFDQAKDVLQSLAEHLETAADDVSIEPGFGVTPDGDRIIFFTLCYAGDPVVGEKVFAPLRAIGEPMSDTVARMPYHTLQTAADGYFAHGRQNYLKSSFIRTLSPAAIDAMVDNYEGDYLPDTWIEHLGGAVSRIAPTATAFSHRDKVLNYGISAVWDDPAESEMRIAKIREYYAAIEPHMSGFYTNLHEETEQKTWGNYGVNYPRLVEVKDQFDPTNLFRLNSNVKPSA